MKKRLRILLILVMALMMAAPAAAYAAAPPANAGGVGTLTVEYSFMEGEDPGVANEITRFGMTYYLVSQTDPVLQSTLPNVREYSYRIEGALLPEQLADIQGLGQVTFTPSWLMFEREIDREVKLTGLPSNDVDSIPKTRVFDDVNQGREDGSDFLGEQELKLTGITFEDITKSVNIPGPGTLSLPAEYTAIAVYRGVETYSVLAYYTVDMVIVTEEDLSEDAYVIVAEYQTDAMPPPVDIAETPLPPTEQIPTDLTDEDQILISQQTGNPFVDIANGNVPLGGLNESAAWSFLSLILSVAAICFAGMNVLTFITKRKQVKAVEALGAFYEERLALLKKRGNLLALMTVFMGVMTLIMWLYLDNFHYGMVWINAYTPIAGILFGFTFALNWLKDLNAKKIIDEDEGAVETESATA